MASPTQWTWLWASFGSWWWTAKAGMLQSMRLQRIGHSWVTELTVHQLILHFQIKHKDSSEKCPHNRFLGQTPHMSALTPDRGFPHASVGRKFTCNTRGCLHAGDPGTISGREDPLEREMATQSNSFAWEIPWTRGAWGGYSPWGPESGTIEWLSHTRQYHLYFWKISLSWLLQC